jgi:hypothetical protein
MRLLRATAQKLGLCVLVGIHSFIPSVRAPFGLRAELKWRVVLMREIPARCAQVLNDATAAGHPALGASFTFLTDATVWLARLPGQDHELRAAQVLRSRISVRVHPFKYKSLEYIDSVIVRQLGRVVRFGYGAGECWRPEFDRSTAAVSVPLRRILVIAYLCRSHRYASLFLVQNPGTYLGDSSRETCPCRSFARPGLRATESVN